LSTHSRLACALGVLGVVVPAGTASADSGGVSYASTSTSSQTTKSSPRATSNHSTSPARIRHLGDRVPVRSGMRGHDVKILQDFFNRLGLTVSIDGSFGHQTLVATRRFEQRMGLTVDGVIDAGDIAALRKVVAQGGFPPPPAPPELPAGSQATVDASGLAAAPADAPQAVKDIITAGNQIASKPYRYGGGHAKWQDTAYDCSGSVSYALHGAGLMQVSRDSTGFETFGATGPGQWVTIYANSGHVWMMVAGLRFDTSGLSSAGSRWQTAKRSTSGYIVRHPVGL
jgi:peptidoglycan hydrolase-like protein with peptidoglycan-binding domain